MSSVPGAEAIVDRLRFLWSEGLIEVYKYDVSKTEFSREEKAADVDFRTDWYFITQRGREELDLNWGEEEAG